MGQRRGNNEAPLRHVWRRETESGMYECTCHGIRIGDYTLVTYHWIVDKVGVWKALDLIWNILENGVDDEYSARKWGGRASNVRLSERLRKDQGLRLPNKAVSRDTVEWAASYGKQETFQDSD